MNNVVHRETYTGNATSAAFRLAGTSLAVTVTGSGSATLQVSSTPDVSASWTDLATQAGGGTTEASSPLAYGRIVMTGTGEVTVSSSGAKTGSGGGGGGGGDASASNQVIGNTRLGDVAETPATSDTASSGLNGLLKRALAHLTSLLGRTGDLTEAAPASDTASSGLNGRLQRIAQNLTSQGPLIGAVNETAPASDTASSGMNGRLQRIAQRLTALIALLPASLGAKAGTGSLSIVPATDGIFVTGGITANPTANFTRPADTTAYAAGDLVANSTTAGSVTPMSVTVTRVAAGAAILRRLRLRKSGTSLTSASFRVHLFATSPTVTNGDNGAFASNNVANYLGSADITMSQAFSDGAWGVTDVSFTDLHVKLASGSAIFALIEARAAYTPISGEVFTLAVEALQD